VVGYSGTVTRTCQLDGTFGEITGSCSQIVCQSNTFRSAIWPQIYAGETSLGTCVPGWANTTGVPSRSCALDGLWFDAVVHPCTRLTCGPATNDANANWDLTLSGELAVGTCVPGWSGSPVRTCTLEGVFAAPSVNCVQITCAATTEAQATWSVTNAGASSTGTCVAGWAATGSVNPTRSCSITGGFEAITGSCYQLECPTETASSATWATTLSGATADGLCVAGWTGAPTRTCQLDGTWTAVTNPCVRRQCSLSSFSDAVWPQTFAGDTVVGACTVGWAPASSAANTTRACLLSGDWDTSVTNACVQLQCPAVSADLNAWPLTLSGVTVAGTCPAGYAGNPTRLCQLDGTWAATANGCQRLQCTSSIYQNAVWSTTDSNETATGTCIVGYGLTAGSVSRVCLITGVWDTAVVNTCVQLSCPALSEGNAAWAQTTAGSTASGTCGTGFAGAPFRTCDSTGAWQAIQSPCAVLTCPGTTAGFAIWPATTAGTGSVSGTCVDGYGKNNNVTPTRNCPASGTWSSVTSPCVQLFCPVDNNAGFSANFPSTAAGAVGVGVCTGGTSGAPRRQCQLDGTWSSTILANDCTNSPCPALTGDNNANWPSGTALGGTATGTCISGFAGSPTRACNNDGTWSSTIINACLQLTCSATSFDGAAFATVVAGTSMVVGTCPPGNSGGSTYNCTLAGSWVSVTSNPCTPITCASRQESNVLWPVTSASAFAFGECDAGWTGSPSRQCGSDGNWRTISNPCVQLTCSQLSNDGNAAWPATLANSFNVPGTCAVGYAGAPTRACQPDGTWSAISNGCVQLKCPALSSSSFASWPLTPQGSQAVGTCISGYTGSATRPCNVDGTWGTASSSCTPILCLALSNDNNAAWPVTTAGTTVVTGTCVSGYQGQPSRACSITGVWGAISSPCTQIICPALASNANASWPQSVAGGVAIGTCLAGYTGSASRVCNNDGSWAVATSSCVQLTCASLTEGNAFWSTQVAGSSSVSGTCVAGYAGAPTRSCSITGVWSSIADGCTVIQCPSLSASASASWPATNAGSQAVGTCLPGFSGSAQRLCQLDGTWATATSSCTQISCGALSSDGDASWVSALSGTTAAPGVCVTGWSGSPTRDCSLLGVWGTIQNPCTQLSCPELSSDALASWPSTLSGNQASGTCIAGFAGSASRQCQQNGSWGTATSSCTQIRCPLLSNDGNAVWLSSNAGSSGVTGQCVAGYQGTPSRDCSITGAWGVISDSCTQRQCPALDSDAQASWAVTNAGSQATGTCNDGYTGSASRLCQLDGTWGAATSTCTRIFCLATTDNPTATWQSTPSGQTAVAGTCNAGYQPTGNLPTRDCNLDGSWGAVTDPCQQLSCASTNEAFATYATSLAGTQQVQGTCIAGYTGTPRRNCGVNGQWSAITGACVPVLCPALSNDGNADWAGTVAAGTVATGTCRAGWAGSPKRLCEINGVWNTTIVDPCTQVFCSATTESNSNWAVTATAASGVLVTGTCAATFGGSPQRTCNPDGTWGAISSPCAALFCPSGSVSNAAWAQTRAGESATGTCNPSYAGAPTRACSVTGTWGSIVNPCTLVIPPCPQDFNYASAVWPETEPGATAFGACNNGFTSNGVPTRQCVGFAANASSVWSPQVTNACFFGT
jgi:hypothetical protein